MDHISGESLPIHVKNLDRVAAGSRNNDGILVLVTTHTYQESTPARIVKMAADAQVNNMLVQTLCRWYVEKTSTIYTLWQLLQIQTMMKSKPEPEGFLPNEGRNT